MYCFYPVHVPPRISNISGKSVQQSYEVSEVSAPATAMQKRKSRAPLYPIVRNVMRSALSEWIYPPRGRPSEPFPCKISSGISNEREPFGGGGNPSNLCSSFKFLHISDCVGRSVDVVLIWLGLISAWKPGEWFLYSVWKELSVHTITEFHQSLSSFRLSLSCTPSLTSYTQPLHIWPLMRRKNPSGRIECACLVWSKLEERNQHHAQLDS